MEIKWAVFSYTLTAKMKSSARVALWRRLQRLGAVSSVGGLYLLPATATCIESFHWLVQDVQAAGGQALVMHVARFEGMDDTAVMALFHHARFADYTALDEQIVALEAALNRDHSVAAATQAQDDLTKLKRRYTEIVNIDYFKSYATVGTGAQLEKLTQLLWPETPVGLAIPQLQPEAYQGKAWVTRPQPHVDRLACIWFIRRFIDANAMIRYATHVATDFIGCHMQDERAEFGHVGNLCTFEVMVKAFAIATPGMNALAELVHAIDLQDERFIYPEAIGIDAILQGWLLQDLSDAELAERGVALFDGIYQTLSNRS